MQIPHAIKHCIIVINPGSTHVQRGRKFAKELKALLAEGAVTTIVATKKDHANPDEFVDKLAPQLDKHTLLAIAGGDGSISYIINLLMCRDDIPAKARHAILLPLWGGNANDLAYMANGLAFGKHMDTVLENSRVVRIYPLHVTIKDRSHSKTTFAICYASFGASAFVAHKINQPKHREKRVYRLPGIHAIFEASSVTKALVDAKVFRCEIDGVTQKLYDLMLINGSRIAKVDRAPIKLTDPYFYEIRTTHNRPVILGYAASLVRHITQRRPPIAVRTLIAHDPTWAQLDGEVQQIPAEAEVTVRLHDKPLYLLSTKLSNE